MMHLHELHQKIEHKEAVLGVIGLGYVGLPVGCVFAEAGFQVVGVEIRADRVAQINQGESPIKGQEPGLDELLQQVVASGKFRATTSYTDLAEADVLSINVETPVGADHIPQYEALKATCRSLGPVLKPGALVIVESTVAPGTVDHVVTPLLEETSGRRVNEGFFVGACPERVMPGKLLSNLYSISRVCGGSTPATAQAMVALYRHIVQADLDSCDIITAELVKTTENAYRDVQIAFANEVALICEVNGADVWEVRELVNKSPYRAMHLPGTGVGGHCIPKDPWLLASAGLEQVPLRLIPAARAINDGMPRHVADMVAGALATAGIDPTTARVAVLGYAYLENSDDTRNSPAEALVEHLQAMGMAVVVHDPWVADYQGDLVERVRGCDAAVVTVGHNEYRRMDMSLLKAELRTPILVDGRGLFDPQQVRAAGLSYRGVGR